MNVLMMHRDDGLVGGAQIQMNRLRRALRSRGVNARVLCRDAACSDSVTIPRRPLAERMIGAFSRRLGFNELHLVGSHDLVRLPKMRQVDVLDLHCLHSGTFSYAALPAMCRLTPTVFTFHDMWPITGHCHASLDCDRWKTGCGKCPYPEVEPAVRCDSTALEWRMKRGAFLRSRFTIVTPSRWLADRVGESMLAGFPLHHIPHGLDLGVFKPIDKRESRELLGIAPDRRVLLCAIDQMDRPLKGGELLGKALNELPEHIRRGCVLVLLGKAVPGFRERIPMPVIDLGYISHDPLKAIAYSAADLTINPSRAESFGLVCLESLACGVPVAAFAVGGVPEIVKPGVTGELAVPEDAASLARTIADLISNPERLAVMAEHSRNLVISRHSLDDQAGRYIELYQKLLGDSSVNDQLG